IDSYNRSPSTKSAKRSKANSMALLRERAEKRLRQEKKDVNGMSSDDLKSAIHELHVHQIELEMQNEQLRISHVEVERARERYVELFDSAPVGYLTLNKHGIIAQANLTSVSMLGLERSKLLAIPFSRFVVSEDQEAYYLCWRRVFESPSSQSCDVRLRPAAGEAF